MKKLLVLFLSAVLVLAFAAVSMGAAVKGDFRYDMYQDETSKSGDESYSVTDLRVTVEGQISDSVSAMATFQLVHGKDGVQGATNSADFDAETHFDNFDMNEYYVTYKQGWGSVKAGYYEYKFTPSRLLLKSASAHVWDKVDVMTATTFKTPIDGLTADLLWQPYQQKKADEGNYGLTVAYKAENWGVQGTYAEYTEALDLFAFDAYYMINDTMKVFLLGVDYSGNDGAGITKYDGLDPVIGFSWDKIGGSKVFAGIEYAIEQRFDGNAAKEFDEYTIQVKYKFNNKVGLEIEHYQAEKDKLKDIVRLRYQF